MKFCFYYITTPNKKIAQKISLHLLKKRLVACTNIIPGMESHFRWQNKLHKDREVILILKSKKSLFKKIASEVKRLHPYECPCIVTLSLAAGERNYLKWLANQVM